jgi:hypothetical protein
MNLLLTGLLCATLSAPAPDDEKPDAVVKAKAEEVLQLLLKGDYKKFVALTYPRIVKEMGGPEKMADDLAAKMKQLKEQGYELRSLKADDPTSSAEVGERRFVVVPYALEMKSPGGKMTVKSFLVAISSDKGKTWTFVDGAGIRDVEAQKKLLPELPDPPALRLPRLEKPIIEAAATRLPRRLDHRRPHATAAGAAGAGRRQEAGAGRHQRRRGRRYRRGNAQAPGARRAVAQADPRPAQRRRQRRAARRQGGGLRVRGRRHRRGAARQENPARPADADDPRPEARGSG